MDFSVSRLPATIGFGLRPLPAGARDQPPAARRGHYLPVLVHNLAAPDGDDGPAGYLPAGKDRELPVGEYVLIPDGAREFRVPDDDVGVGANRDHPLPR